MKRETAARLMDSRNSSSDGPGVDEKANAQQGSQFLQEGVAGLASGHGHADLPVAPVSELGRASTAQPTDASASSAAHPQTSDTVEVEVMLESNSCSGGLDADERQEGVAELVSERDHSDLPQTTSDWGYIFTPEITDAPALPHALPGLEPALPHALPGLESETQVGLCHQFDREVVIKLLRGCLAASTGGCFNQSLTEITAAAAHKEIVWGGIDDWQRLRPCLMQLLAPGPQLPQDVMAVEAVRFRDPTFTPPNPTEEFWFIHGGTNNVYGVEGSHFMPLLSVEQYQRLTSDDKFQKAKSKAKWKDMVCAVSHRGTTADDTVRDGGDCFFDSLAVRLHIHGIKLKPNAPAIVDKWMKDKYSAMDLNTGHASSDCAISRASFLMCKPSMMSQGDELNITCQAAQYRGATDGNGCDVKVAYVCLCKNSSESECLTRMLLASCTKDLARMERCIDEHTQLVLLNFQSQQIMGPFQAVSNPQLFLCPDAFGGKWPAQVQVKPMLGYFIRKAECFPHYSAGPKTPEETEELLGRLNTGDLISTRQGQAWNSAVRATASWNAFQ